jgi:hypothetical protein
VSLNRMANSSKVPYQGGSHPQIDAPLFFIERLFYWVSGALVGISVGSDHGIKKGDIELMAIIPLLILLVFFRRFFIVQNKI